MSSPAAAPTPASQTHSFQPNQSQKSIPQARPATATNPSTPGPTGIGTPGQHATPSSAVGAHAPFLSPSVSRVAGVAGKTPAGKSVPGKGLGGKGLGAGSASSPNAATNMAATPSQTGMQAATSYDSPAAALAAVGMEPTSSSAGAMHTSLSGLGLNGLGMTGNLSTMGMLNSLSHGMMGASSMGLAGPKLDDAERRRRLESVLHTVGHGAGRISQEGVQRLARRMGLEMYDEMREGDEGGMERSLMVAGKSTFAVDVCTHVHVDGDFNLDKQEELIIPIDYIPPILVSYRRLNHLPIPRRKRNYHRRLLPRILHPPRRPLTSTWHIQHQRQARQLRQKPRENLQARTPECPRS